MNYISIPEFGFIRIHKDRKLDIKDLFNRTLELSAKIQKWIRKRDSLQDLIPEDCYVVNSHWNLNDPDALVYKRSGKGIAFASQSCYQQRFKNLKAIRQDSFVETYDKICGQLGHLYRARQIYRNLILSIASPEFEKFRKYNGEGQLGRLVIDNHWFYVRYENDTFGAQWVIDWEDLVEWELKY